MENQPQQTSNQYALVSSLYGPGTIACWYLTILSVLVSWTLHPRKRKSGSIDVDLIAVLTLPTVAAGHLISQLSTLLHDRNDFSDFNNDASQHIQTIAAIEAPFSVVESFMIISVVMFLVTVWTLCFRRAIAVATIGLLCLATESYIHFSSFEKLNIRYRPLSVVSHTQARFSRSFVADFTGLVVAIPLVLAICAATASMVVAYMLRSRRLSRETRSHRSTQPSTPRGLDEELDELDELEQIFAEKQRAKPISFWISMMYLNVALLFSIAPAASNSYYISLSLLRAQGLLAATLSGLKTFMDHFFPKSSNFFSDLDQAVATGAGATVLGFSIYSLAKARYEMRHGEQTTRTVEDEIELTRVSSNQAVTAL